MYQNTWFIPVILPLSLAHILKRLGNRKKTFPNITRCIKEASLSQRG